MADLTGQRREAALARALHDLPARYREAIVLCDLQELSYETAAAALGCAIGTVRSRLHRGRARLSRALGEKEQDGCDDGTTGNVAHQRALEARR